MATNRIKAVKDLHSP